MSKSTETTNDRVPRVLVRFGKHHRVYGNTIECMETPIECMETPSSVWKHHRVYGNTHQVWGNTHRACGNTHRACGNIIERGETLVSRGETHIERGETWGCTEAYRGVAEGGPRRCRRGAEALPKAKWRGVGGV
jgi:hypothetical protein